MRQQTIALFGEAEKGEYCVPHICQSLEDLIEILGNPPTDSQGLLFAIQALLLNRHLLFFRVEEEGFSKADYMMGLDRLQTEKLPLTALAMPGVGDSHIIDASLPICMQHKSLLLINEKDFYDYLTM